MVYISAHPPVEHAATCAVQDTCRTSIKTTKKLKMECMTCSRKSVYSLTRPRTYVRPQTSTLHFRCRRINPRLRRERNTIRTGIGTPKHAPHPTTGIENIAARRSFPLHSTPPPQHALHTTQRHPTPLPHSFPLSLKDRSNSPPPHHLGPAHSPPSAAPPASPSRQKDSPQNPPRAPSAPGTAPAPEHSAA